MRRPSNRRPGFALVWVIVTIAILAALFAAAAPTLVSLDDRARAQSAADQLNAIGTGFRDFVQQVGHYPGQVSQLTNVLTAADQNTCGVAMTGADIGNWPDDAPYVTFHAAPTGTWTEIGRIRDQVPTRNNPPALTPIYVELPGVTGEAAAMLDLLVDHGTGDTVTYNPTVNDTTTIKYRVVSSGQLVANNRC